MFLNDVHKKDEIQCLAIGDLKKIGIKYRPKKCRQHTEEKRSRKVFKRPLHLLPVETVTLPSGQQLLVPKILHELCSFVIQKIDTEGLFRKGGSKNRQNEIKLSLDAGCCLGDEHHEIDVANILKTFFRELPEPLIPYSFHELFLRCVLLENQQVEATLLACLLLPTVHLNTLAYFMQFLHRVTEYYEFNKMNAYNIAVVIGPTLFPAEEKIPQNATLRMTKTCDLFKLLIINASHIGVLSDSIIERIAQSNNIDMQDSKKKKKRRSGSLTRILSGFKKIVTHKTEEAPPDVVMTPCLTRSAKKRRLEAVGLSAKKRRDILNNLPQNAILNTPFTPIRTPVLDHPNGSHAIPSCKSGKPENAKEKRLLWSQSNKKNKKATETSSTSSIHRRWSVVSSAAGFKKKARNSCIGTETARIASVSPVDPHIDNERNVVNEELQSNDAVKGESGYVRISKAEYEEIKSRVTAIERRISVELESADIAAERNSIPETGVEEVSKKYEETLIQTEPLSPSTDQLAKRLSRELKIRPSGDNRTLFRSPSARKIGSIRRKEANKTRLSRTQTWNGNHLDATPNSKLRRSITPIPPPRSTANLSAANTIITDSSGASWKSAEGYFNTPDMPLPILDNNCRASLARLRSQNAGMVLAKARLFDKLGDNPHAEEVVSDVTAHRLRQAKIGAPRVQLNRVRVLRMEERRKKTMSPRKRPCRSPGIHRMPKSTKDINQTDIACIPKQVPHIKTNLTTKSTSKLCKTPKSSSNFKQTPLKASRLVLE